MAWIRGGQRAASESLKVGTVHSAEPTSNSQSKNPDVELTTSLPLGSVMTSMTKGYQVGPGPPHTVALSKDETCLMSDAIVHKAMGGRSGRPCREKWLPVDYVLRLGRTQSHRSMF
jgi:hypothetical protein